MEKPRAWIVNTGTELCIGRVVNTNGAWLAQQLTLRGADVRRIVAVPDLEEEVVPVLREAMRSARIVVVTGGLGPTDDDRTAEFLAKALGRRLVLNEDALRMVEEKYRAAGLPLTPERRKMAMIPEGAKPIPNPVGTAPGIHLVVDGTHVFALPGVPREMMAMFESYVLPVLEREGVLPKLCVVEEGLRVEGLPESTLAPILRRAARLCSDCYVKSHPAGEELGKPIIEVKVLASAPNCEEARRKAAAVLEALRREVEQLGPTA